MSKQEKIAWIMFVGISLIAYYYFSKLLGLGPAFDLYSGEMRRIVHHVISLTVVLCIVLYVTQNSDESKLGKRDIEIQAKADNLAYNFILIAIVASILFLVFGSKETTDSFSGGALAHILLAILILSSIAKHLWKALLYRISEKTN